MAPAFCSQIPAGALIKPTTAGQQETRKKEVKRKTTRRNYEVGEKRAGREQTNINKATVGNRRVPRTTLKEGMAE